MLIDRTYCVEWDQGTGSWRLIWDSLDRETPAAYYTAAEAEERRAEMASGFPEYEYRVVGYEHRQPLDAGADWRDLAIHALYDLQVTGIPIDRIQGVTPAVLAQVEDYSRAATAFS